LNDNALWRDGRELGRRTKTGKRKVKKRKTPRFQAEQREKVEEREKKTRKTQRAAGDVWEGGNESKRTAIVIKSLPGLNANDKRRGARKGRGGGPFAVEGGREKAWHFSYHPGLDKQEPSNGRPSERRPKEIILERGEG